MPQMHFRDGPRYVIDSIANLMAGMDVRTMTYDQALEAANKRQVDIYFSSHLDKTITDHMRRHGG